jgi:hypothetical protein
MGRTVPAVAAVGCAGAIRCRDGITPAVQPGVLASVATLSYPGFRGFSLGFVGSERFSKNVQFSFRFLLDTAE